MEAVVLAAGSSTRMGSGTQKQLMRLGGKPIVVFVLERLLQHDAIDSVFLAIRSDHQELMGKTLDTYGLTHLVRTVVGGQTRQESVLAGLRHVRSERVLIHEAARPIITPDLIDRVVNAVGSAVVPVVEIPFTVAVGNERMEQELNRSELRNVQLPQVFDTKLLLDAHLEAESSGATATEDSQLIFRKGHEVVFVEGSQQNIKVTYPGDLVILEDWTFREGASN
jgi:2-C-methyl-D-erythritol 4-phosphate cytidylyltransferase